MKKSQLAAFVFSGLVVFGCTSLLGDFEVAPVGTDGGTCTPGSPGCTADGCPTGQTKCGDACVDTQASTANCGACNRACPSGLACASGNCQCPDQGAFCDGQCFPRTDRQHCGVTCIACTGNQVCDGKCVDPPPPAFEKVPRSATGWKDAANNPLTVTVKDTGQPGTIYECRTFALAIGNPPGFTACDGGPGTGRVHRPGESPGTPEGTYVTEYRYKIATYTSPVIATRYYVHKSLDGVASCPRQGVPLDGPHFTDEQYFAAALAFSQANASQFPTNNAFPQGGEKREDPIYLGNPWIKIPFSRITQTGGMRSSGSFDDDPWPPANGNYLFNERSLRHRWVLNPQRNLVMVQRQYIHPTTNDCKQRYEIGDELELRYGPPGRGRRKLECEAYVLNTQGNAICLNPNPAKPSEPIAVPIDMRIPATAGASQPFLVNTYDQVPYIHSPTAGFTTAMIAGGFVQVPEGLYSRWYRISTTQQSSASYLYLTEPFAGGTLTNQKIRYVDKATPAFVVGSGFAKLHQDAHSWATGKKRIPFITGTQIAGPRPSHRTKCETPGCNAGKPWLTYLPP